MRITGSLQSKRGIFQMMTRLIFDDGTVKQKQKSTGIRAVGKNSRETRKNEIKANQMLAEYIQELSLDYNSKPKKLFIDAMTEWLSKKKRELRTDTYESYLCTYSAHIKPWFEPKRLTVDQITPRIIETYFDNKMAEGKSASTVLKHKVLLNGVFEDAILRGELTSNPAERVTVKDQKKDFEGTAYDYEQAKKLLSVVKFDPI